MNAPLLPERIVGAAADDAQPELPLASEGVQRYVWQSAFGQMLIEVRGGDVFVNGALVEPASEPLQNGDRHASGTR